MPVINKIVLAMCILFLHTDDSPAPISLDSFWPQIEMNTTSVPASQAHFWEEDATVIGGRDMEPGREGGTWLSLSSLGRIAVLLNVTGENNNRSCNLGRGFLVHDFVTNKDKDTHEDYLEKLNQNASVYSPFNFISIEVGSKDINVYQSSNASGSKKHAEKVGSGAKGWGNSSLSNPFSKVIAGKSRFKDIVKTHGTTETKETLVQELLSLLKWNKSHLPDAELQKRLCNQTPAVVEKTSSVFIHIPERGYGTRTHSIILIDVEGNIDFMEWTMKEPIDPYNPTWLSIKHSSKLKCF